MKKCHRIVILILSITLIFSLTACNNNNDHKKEVLTFQGESQNWEGTFIQESIEVWDEDENIKTSYESSSEDKFILKYKGNDIKSVGTFKYEYISNIKSGSGTTDLNQDGIVSMGGGGSGALLREDHIITVTVERNNYKETFEMSSVK